MNYLSAWCADVGFGAGVGFRLWLAAPSRGQKLRVVAVIHPDNQASRRVAEKCGLTFWKEMELGDSGRFRVYHNRSPAAD